MNPLLIASISFLAAAVILLLHHGWHHSGDDPSTSLAQRESCVEVCYFQPSDVCNFRTWNHEQFILLFISVSFILALISLAEN